MGKRISIVLQYTGHRCFSNAEKHAADRKSKLEFRNILRTTLVFGGAEQRQGRSRCFHSDYNTLRDFKDGNCSQYEGADGTMIACCSCCNKALSTAVIQLKKLATVLKNVSVQKRKEWTKGVVFCVANFVAAKF